MYFFRVELKCFDDDSEVVFLLPDQTAADEKGVPFSEKLLTNSPEFKDFVKRTQTPVVDVTYTVYNCSESLTKPPDADSFEMLDENGSLEKIDGNSFPISTGKEKKFDLKKLTSNKLYLAIAGGAVVLLIIIIIAAASAGKAPDKELPESSEITARIPKVPKIRLMKALHQSRQRAVQVHQVLNM